MSLIVFLPGFHSSATLILPVFENSQWWLDPDHSPLVTFCPCAFKIQLFCLFFFSFQSPFIFFFSLKGRCWCSFQLFFWLALAWLELAPLVQSLASRQDSGSRSRHVTSVGFFFFCTSGSSLRVSPRVRRLLDSRCSQTEPVGCVWESNKRHNTKKRGRKECDFKGGGGAPPPSD